MFDLKVQQAVNNHLSLEITCCKIWEGWNFSSNLNPWETIQHAKCWPQHLHTIESMFDLIVQQAVNNYFSLEITCCKIFDGWHFSSNLHPWETIQHAKCCPQHLHTIESMFHLIVQPAINNHLSLESTGFQIFEGWNISSNLHPWETIQHGNC